jgi:purine-binding chemotaxis protein CheW
MAQLALVPLMHDPGADRAREASQYLTFMLGAELYAVPIASIREVVEFHGLTRIPLAPSVVPGVLNLRGAVVPVVDLSARFGRAPMTIGRRTCVVVVEMQIAEGVYPLGVIVDSVSEALEVEAHQLEQRPAFGSGLRADFVAGMLNLGGRFVVVLELTQVLSMNELEQMVTDAAQAGEPSADPTRERRA